VAGFITHQHIDGHPGISMSDRLVTAVELRENSTAESCFVSIDGIVYDVTQFLPSHPGGSKIVLNASGEDASTTFHAFHKASVLTDVATPYRIGRLSVSDTGSEDAEPVASASFEIQRCTSAQVDSFANVRQFEEESLKRLPPALGAGFIGYGSEDNMSLDANLEGYIRYSLRPRVLRDVSNMNTTTSILGGRVKLDFPVLVAPFTNAKAAHPEGEIAVGAAVAAAGVGYAVPHYANYPLPEVRDALAGTGTQSGGFLFQMYPVKKQSAGDTESMLGSSGIVRSAEDDGLDREYTAGALRYASGLGCKAVLLTVDTANNANRERTYKNPQWVKDMAEQCGGLPEPRALEGAAVRKASGHTAALSWEDVRWMVRLVREEGLDMGVVLKGIMTAEDTALAAGAGVDGVVVSNHGGRQLDGTPGTIECLEECVQAAAELGGVMDVYLDGGLRRGKDVFKALALGAKAVFVGRPALWGLSVGGEPGVAKVLAILKEELTTVMQLCGCASVGDIGRGHVRDARSAGNTNSRL
jgi:L-lactate dehydrogenase (cytochrome)